MKLARFARRAVLTAGLAMLAACALDAPQISPTDTVPVRFPANNAKDVNPDTHLVLTFASPPKIGSSGLIRIYDAVDNSLVDTLDLSIPTSPNPSGRSAASTEGWGPVQEPPDFDSSNVRFMEYNTKDMQGRPADVSQRHPIVRQLTLPNDAEIIANYSNPEFVLGGWKPVVE